MRRGLSVWLSPYWLAWLNLLEGKDTSTPLCDTLWHFVGMELTSQSRDLAIWIPRGRFLSLILGEGGRGLRRHGRYVGAPCTDTRRGFVWLALTMPLCLSLLGLGDSGAEILNGEERMELI